MFHFSEPKSSDFKETNRNMNPRPQTSHPLHAPAARSHWALLAWAPPAAPVRSSPLMVDATSSSRRVPGPSRQRRSQVAGATPGRLENVGVQSRSPRSLRCGGVEVVTSCGWLIESHLNSKVFEDKTICHLSKDPRKTRHRSANAPRGLLRLLQATFGLPIHSKDVQHIPAGKQVFVSRL